MPEPDPLDAEPRLRVLVHDAATGEIAHVAHNVPASLVAAQAGPGQAALATDLGDGGGGWWVDAGVPRRKAPILLDRLAIVADGEDVATAEIPGPFTVLVDGHAHFGEDLLEFAAAIPGSYRLQVDCHPWLPLDVVILAVATPEELP